MLRIIIPEFGRSNIVVWSQRSILDVQLWMRQWNSLSVHDLAHWCAVKMAQYKYTTMFTKNVIYHRSTGAHVKDFFCIIPPCLSKLAFWRWECVHVFKLTSDGWKYIDPHLRSYRDHVFCKCRCEHIERPRGKIFNKRTCKCECPRGSYENPRGRCIGEWVKYI